MRIVPPTRRGLGLAVRVMTTASTHAIYAPCQLMSSNITSKRCHVAALVLVNSSNLRRTTTALEVLPASDAPGSALGRHRKAYKLLYITFTLCWDIGLALLLPNHALMPACPSSAGAGTSSSSCRCLCHGAAKTVGLGRAPLLAVA
jgi:hypothetical protein